MRLSKFALLIVLVLFFIGGMATHSLLQRYGISLRAFLSRPGSSEIKRRQTSTQYVTIRDFFAAFPGHANVVMFGDSQIAFADWPLLLDIPVANRGIYGETTAGATLRVDAIIAANPKCVVTMLGIADLSIGRSVDDTARDYLSILDRLSTSGIEVIVQSILPTEPPYVLNKKVAELNTKLKAACYGKCTFLDLDPIFALGATIDGIHLKPNTYKKWAETLKPAITAHCGIPR